MRAISIAVLLLGSLSICLGAEPLAIPDPARKVIKINLIVEWRTTLTWFNGTTTDETRLFEYDPQNGRYLISTVEQSGGDRTAGSSGQGGADRSETEPHDPQRHGDHRHRSRRAAEVPHQHHGQSERNREPHSAESHGCQPTTYKVPAIVDLSKLDDVVTGDGKRRRVITVNGRMPAPTLVVPFGSELVVRVSNRLITEGLTVHFHGIDKKNRWYMDGAARLQQCPIPAGSDFVYRFTADVAGTHFYHGHSGLERAEGLYGAFVVMPADRRVHSSTRGSITPVVEYSVILFDWGSKSSTEMWHTHQQAGGHECAGHSVAADGTTIGATFPLSAITINRKGWYDQTDVLRRPHLLDLETYAVEEGGKSYLFRVINAAQSNPLVISVEDHKLEVVSTDGSPIRGVPADFLILYPGERYDFLLISKSEAARSTYYMIVEALDFYGAKGERVRSFVAMARLQYRSDSESPRISPPDFDHPHCTAEAPCIVVNCPFPFFPPDQNRTCVNLDRLRSPSPVQKPEALLSAAENGNFEEYFINMNYEEAVNGWLYRAPKGPPYFYPRNESLVMSPCTDENWRGFRKSWCTYTLRIPLGSIVQMTMVNMFGREDGNDLDGHHHPVHLHGTHFHVIKIGYGQYDEDTGRLIGANPDISCLSSSSSASLDCTRPTWSNSSWLHGGSIPDSNSIDPVYKDTVLVPLGGYVVLRFVANNPGWWLAHCHIMDHHMAGMAFAMRIGEHEQIPEPPDGFPRCGVFDF